jgi:hypothetical protein
VANSSPPSTGLLATILGDGRPLIEWTGLALIGAGLFAFFLSATGNFLPHDIAALGMTSEQLRSLADARIANFMIHDRVSFGGAIMGVGVLYLWLAAVPLRQGQAWAWWTLLFSGTIGFSSFLAYLGYGYLDTWHGAVTLVLLPIFTGGLIRSLSLLRPGSSPLTLWHEARWPRLRSWNDRGRWLLLITAGCLMLGGVIILGVGMTTVFVLSDLEYMRLQASDFCTLNPRLIPLIAHDRAGFGGGVCCCGFTMFCCVLFGQASRSLWEAVLLTGILGFGSAIGVHFPIGYVDFGHLLPAFLGAGMFAAGIALTFPYSRTKNLDNVHV